MSRVKTALVGYGFAGKTFHAPLIRAAGAPELTTVVSTKPAAVHADLPDVHVCDLETALADESIELVVIATPNAFHAPQALAALQAGKHVVIDKPFAVDTEEAANLIAVAKQTGRLLSVFHNRRWDADFLTVRSLLDQGVLGEVSLFISRYDRYKPIVQSRWREAPDKGSGVWFDLGSHLTDQVLCLFGWPDAVTADLGQQRDGAAVDDYFHVTYHYGTRRVRLQGSCLTAAPGPRFEIHGSLGSFVKYGLDTQEDCLKSGGAVGSVGWGVDPQDGMLTAVVDGCVQAAKPYPTLRGSYQNYYEGVAAAIRGGCVLPVLSEDALQVMELLDIARRSSEEGRRIACKK